MSMNCVTMIFMTIQITMKIIKMITRKILFLILLLKEWDMNFLSMMSI